MLRELSATELHIVLRLWGATGRHEVSCNSSQPQTCFVAQDDLELQHSCLHWNYRHKEGGVKLGAFSSRVSLFSIETGPVSSLELAG